VYLYLVTINNIRMKFESWTSELGFGLVAFNREGHDSPLFATIVGYLTNI